VTSAPTWVHRAYIGSWGRVFAWAYDPLLARGEQGQLGRLRRLVVEPSRGTVVELGAGTGRNLEHYAPETEVIVTEPDAAMAERLERRAAARQRTEVRRAPAEALPIPDQHADVVISTLVLCTVRDPAAALSEAYRVLRPGGELRFLEHVVSDDAAVAQRQRRWAGAWSVLACGCRCDRATVDFLEPAGFTDLEVDRRQLRGMGPLVGEMVIGRAVRPI